MKLRFAVRHSTSIAGSSLSEYALGQLHFGDALLAATFVSTG